MLDFRRLALILAVLCLASSPVVHAQSRPNILVIIADDFGIDALGLYGVGTVLPETPHIDALAERGLLFENTWSYPMCTPTRAAMISGRYGGKTGVTRAPGTLELEYTTIFEYLTEPEHGEYANALFGKWHIGPSSDFDHPNDQGVDLYAGYNSGGVDSYYRWKRTINGIVDTSERYVTSELTDRAIDWLDGQSGPWLLWMAHAAPHTPLEVPPDSLYSRTDTAGTLNKYMAMIEALDHEIGRLLSSIDAATLENTVVIFLGDNGTPGNLLQAYPSGHGKATLYEGGIRVPMIIAGAGVPRRGSVEPGLVNIVDIYATIASLAKTRNDAEKKRRDEFEGEKVIHAPED